jgi:hypothetical protein
MQIMNIVTIKPLSLPLRLETSGLPVPITRRRLEGFYMAKTLSRSTADCRHVGIEAMTCVASTTALDPFRIRPQTVGCLWLLNCTPF